MLMQIGFERGDITCPPPLDPAELSMTGGQMGSLGSTHHAHCIEMKSIGFYVLGHLCAYIG